MGSHFSRYKYFFYTGTFPKSLTFPNINIFLYRHISQESHFSRYKYFFYTYTFPKSLTFPDINIFLYMHISQESHFSRYKYFFIHTYFSKNLTFPVNSFYNLKMKSYQYSDIKKKNSKFFDFF